MRRTLCIALAAVGFLVLGSAAVRLDVASAEEVDTREIRLLTAEGKFTEANQLLAGAGDEVKNDVKLRSQLGDMAMKWTARQQGGEKIPGLIAARDHFDVAATADPTETDVTQGALEAGVALIELQIEAKQPSRADAHADWTVKTGERLLAAGSDTPDIRLALAKALDHRAKLGHKIQNFDRIVADYGRSADLLVSCAETAKKPAAALGDAAKIYMDLALFIADVRPIDEETRDEEAMAKAVATARQACETKGAGRDEFTTHLLVLREAHRAKIEGKHGKPFMEEVGRREQIDGLNLQIPKAEGWKRLPGSDTWEAVYERQIGDDTSAVQIMIHARRFSDRSLNTTWDRVEDVMALRFEDQKTNDFEDIVKELAPEQLDTGKKGPEIWHFELSGTSGGRARRAAEWAMLRKKKDKVTYHIRLIDWRKTPDLLEPDIVEFLRLALDLPDPDAEDEKGGGKKKRR